MNNHNKYGQIAVKAVEYYKKLNCPIEAWEKAAKQLFDTQSSQEKNCPKSTFLGLCEEGLINGIPIGDYTSSKKNKDYATKAIYFLKNSSKTFVTPMALWNDGLKKDIRHNSQMDVVIALWENQLIK